MLHDSILPGICRPVRHLGVSEQLGGSCWRLVVASLLCLVGFCAAALAAEGPVPAPAATSLPLAQTLCRYGVLIVLFLGIGRVVSGWMRVPFDVSAAAERGVWAMGIALVITFTCSEALLIVPGAGPFIGGYGVEGPPGNLVPTIIGSLFWSVPLVILTLFMYRIAGAMFGAKRGGWSEMFVLGASFVGGNWVMTGVRGKFGLLDPTKAGYAAFFAQVADRFRMPDGTPSFGRLDFVVRPAVSLINFIDGSMHDLGLSTIAFGLLIGFLFSYATYRARTKNREYLSYYNNHLRYIYSDPAELAKQATLVRERMGLGCGYQLLITLAKLAFLVVLYYVFTAPKSFQTITSVLPVSSLGGSVRGFVLPLLAGLSVLLQTASGMWSTAPNVGTALAGGMFGGVVVGVISYFAPAGMVLALTATTIADATQTIYESKLRYLSIGRSLAPAVVIIPLIFLLMPRGMTIPSGPSSSATSASLASLPKSSASGEVGAPGRASPREGDTDLGHIASLRQGKRWSEALQAVDDLTSKRTSSKGVLTELKAGILDEMAGDQMSHNDRAGAFETLMEAKKLAPDYRAVASRLSDIWVQVGREEMKGVCIRRQPSDVASLLSTASVGQVLTTRAVAEKPEKWLPVRASGEGDGWVYAPLIDDIDGKSTIRVKALRGKHDIDEFLTRAVEVNPSSRMSVLLLRLSTNWQVAVGLCLFVVLAGMVVVWIARN